MGRIDQSSAINAEHELGVSYGVDPRGWGMASALAGAHNRDLNGKRAVIATASTDATGWLPALQRFRGLAPLLGGSGLAITKRSSTIGDERSDPGDGAAERILAERWKRQGAGPSW